VSQVGSPETAKRRITQTTPFDSPGTLVFWRRKSGRKSNGVTFNGGAKCRLGTLNAAEVVENWRLSTRSVVNSALSQSYHTFVVLQCVARGLSATADPCFSVVPEWALTISLTIKLHFCIFRHWVRPQANFVANQLDGLSWSALSTNLLHWQGNKIKMRHAVTHSVRWVPNGFIESEIKQVVKAIWHKAASPPNTDGSVVFFRWRQCAPHI